MRVYTAIKVQMFSELFDVHWCQTNRYYAENIKEASLQNVKKQCTELLHTPGGNSSYQTRKGDRETV